MRGPAGRDPSTPGPGGLSLVLWLAGGVITAGFARPVALPAGQLFGRRQGPELLDLYDGGLERGVEALAVEGLEEPVAPDEVLEAVS